MSVTFSVYINGTFMDDPELNVSNVNYVSIMGMLGLGEADASGSYGGTWGDGTLQHVREQLDIILAGLAAMPEMDHGVPAREIAHDDTEHPMRQLFGGGCTVIDCGRPDGYFTRVLTVLKSVVEAAIASDGVVTFG
jgi:hypothetical protein